MDKEEQLNDGDQDVQIYELSYWILPTIAEDDILTNVERIRSVVEKGDAKIIVEGPPQYKDIAYEMSITIDNQKKAFKKGYFGWLKFECLPKEIEAITEAMSADADIIRHLIVDNTREGTSAYQAMPADMQDSTTEDKKIDGKSKKEEKPKEPVEIDEKEIDESIEKLVID